MQQSFVKIGIVEDEVIIAMSLAAALQKHDYEVCFIAHSYEEAIENLQAETPDVLLLDIKLDSAKDGIDLAQELSLAQKLPFIFLTANADTATVERAKRAHPAGYLVKPFSPEGVYAAIEIALQTFAAGRFAENNIPPPPDTKEPLPLIRFEDTLFIRQGATIFKVKSDDILYLEGEGIYTHIATKSRKYALRISLTSLLHYLGTERFWRIHKSYGINSTHIEAIQAEDIVVGKEKIPIGRAYKAELMKRLPVF